MGSKIPSQSFHFSPMTLFLLYKCQKIKYLALREATTSQVLSVEPNFENVAPTAVEKLTFSFIFIDGGHPLPRSDKRTICTQSAIKHGLSVVRPCTFLVCVWQLEGRGCVQVKAPFVVGFCRIKNTSPQMLHTAYHTYEKCPRGESTSEKFVICRPSVCQAWRTRLALTWGDRKGQPNLRVQ